MEDSEPQRGVFMSASKRSLEVETSGYSRDSPVVSLGYLLVASGVKKGVPEDIDKVKGLIEAIRNALCGDVGMDNWLKWTSLAMLDTFHDRPVAQRRDALNFAKHESSEGYRVLFRSTTDLEIRRCRRFV